MIVSLPSPAQAHVWCKQIRLSGKSMGFVPTMGALHAGHLSLVHRALSENDVVCASIFVNPLQFNNADDLENYPSTLAQDTHKLNELGCHMVYTGTLQQFIPESDEIQSIKSLDAGPAATGLEGEFRPGHLQGVVTIVDRLFRTVGACRGYFGEKDYQQTLVVKYLASNLLNDNVAIDIVVCPTIREVSGLAMSSRNQRLSEQDIQKATILYKALLVAKKVWGQGVQQIGELESSLVSVLKTADINVEYASVRDEDNWNKHQPNDVPNKPRALIAAYVGDVRLIDNLALYE
jgi:pantoate--beta-alanine ligase